MIDKSMERMVGWSGGDGVGVKYHDAALYKLRYVTVHVKLNVRYFFGGTSEQHAQKPVDQTRTTVLYTVV
jgi:hypothetical protein